MRVACPPGLLGYSRRRPREVRGQLIDDGVFSRAATAAGDTRGAPAIGTFRQAERSVRARSLKDISFTYTGLGACSQAETALTNTSLARPATPLHWRALIAGLGRRAAPA